MNFFKRIFSSFSNPVEKMIYYPPKTSTESFDKLKSDNSELITITNEKGQKISACIFYPNKNLYSSIDEPIEWGLLGTYDVLKKRCDKYIVFSHGNGADIYSMAHYATILAHEVGINVVMYDYIGYGMSTDGTEICKPSEQGCYDSLETVVNHMILKLHVDPRNIFLVGQSLGTGVTIDFASKNNWKTPMMLISPYLSIGKVGLEMTSSLSTSSTDSTASCLRVVGLDKFNSEQKISKIDCPVKILHGNEDQLIDVSHGEKLYAKLKNKTLQPVWLNNIGHNDILYAINKEYFIELFKCEY